MLAPNEVYQELLERGCALRPGASPADIEKLQIAIGSEISPYVKEIYTLFDGFIENISDDLNQMHIWSIDEILRFRNEMKMESAIVSFGDRLIQSDFISCNLLPNGGRVFLLESQEELSESYEQFWFDFLNSKYDLAH